MNQEARDELEHAHFELQTGWELTRQRPSHPVYVARKRYTDYGSGGTQYDSAHSLDLLVARCRKRPDPAPERPPREKTLTKGDLRRVLNR